MKKITFYYLLLIFFQSCNGPVINDLTEMRLKGKVKYLKETFYAPGKTKFGEIQRGGKYRHIDYNFNMQGNKTEETNYFSDGDIFWKYKFTYNPNNTIVQKLEYDGEGKKTGKVNYVTDDLGRKIEELSYNESDSFEFKRKLAYNRKGKIIKLVYEPSQSKQITDQEYDAKNNLIEVIHYKHDTIYSKTTYNYNESNFLSQEKIWYPWKDINNPKDFENWTYDYIEFDKNNNWIKRIELKEGIAEFLVEREIDYYE